MKIFPDTKVYIVCPANIHTGGPESLHQLASQLIAFGVEAYMLYRFKVNAPVNTTDPVADALKKYHLMYTFKAEDSPHNIIVMPETSTNIDFNAIKNCQRVLWWMSVDNFFVNIMDGLQRHLENLLAEPVPKFFYFNKADNIEHWVQSEYVRQFLKFKRRKKDSLRRNAHEPNFFARARRPNREKKYRRL